VNQQLNQRHLRHSVMREPYADVGSRGSRGSRGHSVGLPPELLSVLPRDPIAQLEVAHSIACHAYEQQVCVLRECGRCA
jgi:hypothetical protein